MRRVRDLPRLEMMYRDGLNEKISTEALDLTGNTTVVREKGKSRTTVTKIDVNDLVVITGTIIARIIGGEAEADRGRKIVGVEITKEALGHLHEIGQLLHAPRRENIAIVIVPVAEVDQSHQPPRRTSSNHPRKHYPTAIITKIPNP